MTEPVIKTITVPCDTATAFRIFTFDMQKWWPLDRHSLSAMDGKAAQLVTVEPGVGGKLIEIAPDGTHHHWGSITVWQPGAHLAFSWHVGRPETEATQVDIRFELTEAGTRVTLTHSDWQVLGDAAAETREGYNSGWVGVFEQAFAEACSAAE